MAADPKQVYAIVLAAGTSSRMGLLKPLLPFGEKTILQSVVDLLLSVDLEEIVVVVGHRADEVKESLAGRTVRFSLNADYAKGMLSSVHCGVAAVPDSADAALIVLADQPQIEARVARRVVSAYKAGKKGIVIPTYRGTRGHPALVDLKRYRDEILRLPENRGLKPVTRGHPGDTLELPVEDAGILRDLDTPEDYRAELERRQIQKS